MFIEDFTEFISTTLPIHCSNLYLGDFNLHVSDVQDTDSAIFNDSTDAMGLYQHVGFQTHKSGNILDLILSDFSDGTKVVTTQDSHFSALTKFQDFSRMVYKIPGIIFFFFFLMWPPHTIG